MPVLVLFGRSSTPTGPFGDSGRRGVELRDNTYQKTFSHVLNDSLPRYGEGKNALRPDDMPQHPLARLIEIAAERDEPLAVSPHHGDLQGLQIACAVEALDLAGHRRGAVGDAGVGSRDTTHQCVPGYEMVDVDHGADGAVASVDRRVRHRFRRSLDRPGAGEPVPPDLHIVDERDMARLQRGDPPGLRAGDGEPLPVDPHAGVAEADAVGVDA